MVVVFLVSSLEEGLELEAFVGDFLEMCFHSIQQLPVLPVFASVSANRRHPLFRLPTPEIVPFETVLLRYLAVWT